MPTFGTSPDGRKTILSSPTRGNPYGRTGAPGAATAPQTPQGGTMTNADAYRAVGQPQYAGRQSPQERNLLAAPPPQPQMQNLAQLQARGAQQAAPAAAPAAYQATGQLQQRPMAGLGAILGSGNQIGGAPNAAAQQQMASQGAAQAGAAQTLGSDPRLQQLYAQYGIR